MANKAGKEGCILKKGTAKNWLDERHLVSKEELDQHYPQGEYQVVGEVAAKSSRKDSDAHNFLSDKSGNQHAILPLATFNRSWKTLGYLQAEPGENKWLEVKQRRTSIFVAGIIVALLIIAAIVAGLVYYFGQGSSGPKIDPSAHDYKSQALDRPANSGGGIILPGYTGWECAPGSTAMNVPLINAAGNDCYMQYTITLKQSGEQLYKSELIPPGKAIQDWNLSHSLPKGSNDIIIKIDTFDLNDYTQPLNGGMIENTITVQ